MVLGTVSIISVLLCRARGCGAVQGRAVRCGAVQCSAVQCWAWIVECAGLYCGRGGWDGMEWDADEEGRWLDCGWDGMAVTRGGMGWDGGDEGGWMEG